MDIAKYFLLPDGRLRAGWRFLLFVLLLAGAYLIVTGIASSFFHAPTLSVQAAILAATVVFPTWLMLRWLEHLPFGAVGLPLQRASLRQLGAGLLSGVGLLGIVVLLECAAGVVSFQASGTSASPVMASLLPMTALLIVSAATEELLFRGYAFQRLVEGAGGLLAVVASSLLFGWGHAQNPSATHLSVLNTVLAGILLALAYLKTQALWLPIGFHFSWNWTMVLAGLPVSGLHLVQTPWRAVASSHLIWLHGGDYGPEGGAIATVVLVLGIASLARMPQKMLSGNEAPSAPSAGGSGKT